MPDKPYTIDDGQKQMIIAEASKVADFFCTISGGMCGKTAPLVFSLFREEMCVGQLANTLGSIQPCVSKKLSSLLEAKLVTVRRDGRHRFYSLSEGFRAFLQRLMSANTDMGSRTAK